MEKKSHFEMIDPPSQLESLPTWERHLSYLEKLPQDTMLRGQLIHEAKTVIARKRREGRN